MSRKPGRRRLLAGLFDRDPVHDQGGLAAEGWQPTGLLWAWLMVLARPRSLT